MLCYVLHYCRTKFENLLLVLAINDFKNVEPDKLGLLHLYFS